MSDKPQDHLLDAYHTMLERVKSSIELADEKAIPTLARNIEAAREKAVELGELTREEAERVGEYLQRDLEAAGDFMTRTGKALADWLSLDVELIENRLLEMFRIAADQTSIELARLAEQASVFGDWKTGEITGIGVLECKSCGEHIHFHKPGRIPPCPKCHGSHFRRVKGTG